MKQNVLFLFGFLLFLTTHLNAQDHPIVHAKSYSVIVVDDNYNHIKPNADKNKKYQVIAADGITVDATEMDFTILKKYLGGNNPDKIFLVCNSGTYVSDFRINDAMILDASTLKPFIGNTKFKGFQKGDTPIVSIGTIDSKSRTSRMKQVWATTFTVE